MTISKLVLCLALLVPMAAVAENDSPNTISGTVTLATRSPVVSTAVGSVECDVLWSQNVMEPWKYAVILKCDGVPPGLKYRMLIHNLHRECRVRGWGNPSNASGGNAQIVADKCTLRDQNNNDQSGRVLDKLEPVGGLVRCEQLHRGFSGTIRGRCRDK